MKTVVSIPDDVYGEAERTAKQLGLSQSELFTRVLREFLGVRRDQAVTRSRGTARCPVPRRLAGQRAARPVVDSRRGE